MIETPCFKSCYRAVLLDSGWVLVISEFSRFLLSEEFSALVPLIDGRHTADEIADALAGSFSSAVVYWRLAELGKAGLIEESHSADPAATAFWTLLGGSGKTVCRTDGTPIAILALTDAAPEIPLERLRGMPVTVHHQRDWRTEALDRASLWVVAVSDYLAPEIAHFNRKALELGLRWILFKPGGVQPWIGPLFEPGLTACWECLAGQLRRYGTPESRAVAAKGIHLPLELSRSALSLSQSLAWDALLVEIGKLGAGCGASSLLKRGVLFLDLATLDFSEHPVERIPGCPACGPPKAAGVLDRQAESTFVPGSRRKKKNDSCARRSVVETTRNVGILSGPGEEADGLDAPLAKTGLFQIVRRQWPVDSLDPVRLWIVVAHDYLAPWLAEVNAAALETGASWLPWKPWGAEAWFGPLFVPDRSACWECLAERLRGHRGCLPGEGAGAEGQVTLCPPPAAVPLSITTGADFLAFQLGRMCFGGEAKSLTDTLLTLDFRSFNLRRHTVTRRPQCPRCGGSPPPERAGNFGGNGIVLRSRIVVDEAGEGYRIRPASDTLAAIEAHISPITGLVDGFQRSEKNLQFMGHCFVSRYPAPKRFQTAGVSRAFGLGTAAGKGMTGTSARMSAAGECIERYCALYQGNEPLISGALSTMSGYAVDPGCLVGYSERQYECRESWREMGPTAYVADPYDEKTEIAWVRAWSLRDETWKAVPACYVFYNFPLEKGRRYSRADSNGMAAGSCLEEAILQGALELVERDAAGIWWYNRLQRPAIDLGTCRDPWVRSAAHGLKDEGYDLQVLDLTNDLGIPVFAGVALHRNDPEAVPLIGFGAHFHASVALRRAILETGQFRALGGSVDVSAASRRFLGMPLSEAPFLRSAPDSAPRPLSAFPHSEPDDLLELIRLLIGRFRDMGLDMLVTDLTRPDVPLNVARVMVPGLVHFWPRLGQRRLYEVPVAMGWLEEPLSESDMNPFPFYF